MKKTKKRDTPSKRQRCRRVPPRERVCAWPSTCGSEVGSYFRLIDFVYHSTLGLKVIKKRREGPVPDIQRAASASFLDNGTITCSGKVPLAAHKATEYLREWYFIAEKPAPAPHLAHPEGCAAL